MPASAAKQDETVEKKASNVAARPSSASYFVVVCLSIGLTFMSAAWLQQSQKSAVLPAKINPSVVDINAADWTSFSQLEGIGPTLGFRIVADRQRFGPFPSIDDLLRVEGIGSLTLDRIRYRLTIGHDQLKPSKQQRKSKQ